MPERRYRSFAQELRRRFDCRVHRVSVDAGFSCPNRDGTRGVGGCIYCDEGSRASYVEPELGVGEQVRRGMERLRRRFQAERFLAYFQPYSNTYAAVEQLRRLYQQALELPEVVGLCVGTRPDCISEEILVLLGELNQRVYLWVEYGLQSASGATLQRINRGHTVNDFVRAVELTHARGIRVCAHVILGFPWEDAETMLASAPLLNRLGVEGIKIHSLYVARGTALAGMMEEHQWELLSLNEYVELVCDYLELLSPDIVVQRLCGETSPERLLAPEWTDKRRILDAIEKELERRHSFQGRRFLSVSLR